MFKKFLIVIIIVAVGGFLYWQNLNSPVSSSSQAENFIVAKGETATQIAKNLRLNNLIRSEFYFKYKIWRGDLKIQAGEYSISPNLSTNEIIKILSQGEAISQEKIIRIIEGWNIKDINKYLNENKIIAENSFINIAKNSANQNIKTAYGLPENANLEGFLFPDTYRINKNATAQDIIDKMLNNFNKKLTSAMKEEILKQKKTIYEIITMASIVEKEVRSVSDMKIVSGIFWNRIKNGQGLQSCATLAYILGVNKAQYSVEDTKINSPYNTYKYRGLPPGPIANPGLNAIAAAIYPENTNYNYFLSDPETGKTIFSKTLEEHNYNKAKYLK